MSTTLDLINAIQKGDSVAIEQHFEYAMTTRIAERLDDMRAYVAKNMFNEDVDVYDYEDVITEADIVDVVITEEDIDQLEENKVPAGIKLFHHDKEGKESYSIHFSAQDAQREEKRRKKMGHKVVAHSLVYGQNDEGERVNH